MWRREAMGLSSLVHHPLLLLHLQHWHRLELEVGELLVATYIHIHIHTHDYLHLETIRSLLKSITHLVE